MSKRTPTVEWHVVDDDTEWTRLCAQSGPALAPTTAPAVQGRLYAQQLLWGAAALLLLLAFAGGWWWRTAQAGSQQVTTEVRTTVHKQLEPATQGDDDATASLTQTATDWWLQHGEEVSDLRAAVQTAEPDAHLDVVLDTIEFQGGQAVLRVFTTAQKGTPAHRQTRFYRRTATGWVQTAPDAALLGPERSLETPSFVFHFRQNDAQAVAAVAYQIAELYTTLRRDVGLPITPAGLPLFNGEKLIIDVSVTQPPGQASPWLVAPDHIIVPSPALYLAPGELTDTDLLAQSIALPLLAQVSVQASERHHIGLAWQPLLDGLRLWQMWDMGLPLAAWRKNIVQWIYVDGPALAPGQTFVLPDRYPELCAAHKLWLPSPAQLNIPLTCARPEWEEQSFPLWRLRDPLTRLEQFSVPASANRGETDFAHPIPHPGQTVAIATLIEYAVATYGRERLPALVAGLGQYDSWETLIPAVFGVSAAEFEAGWQAYLKAHYGIISAN